jgi:hypothetical protein
MSGISFIRIIQIQQERDLSALCCVIQEAAGSKYTGQGLRETIERL